MEILVIEDDPIQHDLLQAIFQKENIVGIFSASGEEGLRKLRKHHVDALFLDVGLPGKSGLQILHALRESEITRDMPVVMLTADKARDTLTQCMRLGITDYIVKPFSPEQLGKKLAHLKRLVEQKNAASDALGAARVVMERKGNIVRFFFGGRLNEESLARFRFHFSQLKAQLRGDDVIFLNFEALPAFSERQRKILRDMFSHAEPRRLLVIAGRSYVPLKELMLDLESFFFINEEDAFEFLSEAEQA